MKIATFNVNGVNGRLDLVLEWLKRDKPDIACLQELKTPQAGFPRLEFEKAGYSSAWHGQKSWNGVAILARGMEIKERRRALAGDPADDQSRYLEAEIGRLIVACLYLPNGNPAPGQKFEYKLRWFARFILHARKLLQEGKPVVLAGDFNVMPTDLDVYAPKRWRDDALFRPEVREAFALMLTDGWIDSLRTLHPKERFYTFWKYWRSSFERDAGLRIDHLLISPNLRKRLVAGGVDQHIRAMPHPSDHAPAWIELADQAKRARKPATKRATGNGSRAKPAQVTPRARQKATHTRRP